MFGYISKGSTNYRKYQAYLADFMVVRKTRPSIDKETVGRQKSMISVKEKDSAGSTQVENSFIRLFYRTVQANKKEDI
jgi:hypothetical protein